MVYVAVGLKLWTLSAQTRQPAERVLAIAILLWGASYVVYDVPFLVSGTDESLVPVLSLSSFVVADLGNFSFAIFTWLVFRRAARWAVVLLGVIAAALVLGWVGSAVMGDWEFLGAHESPFHWFERIGASLTSVWMGSEAFRQYLSARRRRELGLCEPMACNRYLLMAIAATLWIAMDAASIALSLVDGQGSLNALLSSILALETVFATLGASLIGLAFFPPAFYRQWVHGSEAAEAA